MRRHLSELFRYTSVSALALVVDMALFSALLRLVGLPWMLAATAGFLVGVAVNYLMSIHFVFEQRRFAHSPRMEFVAFAVIGVVGLGVTQIVLWVGIEHFGANPELTKLVAAGVTFMCNFGARKLLLFQRATMTC